MSNRKHILCADDITVFLSESQYKLNDLTLQELKIIQKSINELIENKQTDNKETIQTLNANEVAEKLYQLYPRKASKARGIQLILAFLQKGRIITGQGKVKYNHIQLDLAIQAYAKKVQGYEEQYIKVFSTFMNLAVCDFVESTKEYYENYMLNKYGENWKKIKFIYE